MKNLAGNNKADEVILEELYLANIPPIKSEQSKGEVQYSYIGKIGNWKFERAWSYWIVSVEKCELGLPLKQALELHNKKNPIKDDILGNIIRSGGDCDCPSPDEYGAWPIYNEELNKQLISLGYKKHYDETLEKEYIPISVGEISKLCNEGKLTVERYVKTYHIDEQIGLNEFANFIRNLNKCEKNRWYCSKVNVLHCAHIGENGKCLLDGVCFNHTNTKPDENKIIATHTVLDLVYTPDEGQECFQGTEKECYEFIEQQGDATFTYKVVPNF